MQPIAYVKEIWRYPVKSMGGEALQAAMLAATGIVGDRQWAVLDGDGVLGTSPPQIG